VDPELLPMPQKNDAFSQKTCFTELTFIPTVAHLSWVTLVNWQKLLLFSGKSLALYTGTPQPTTNEIHLYSQTFVTSASQRAICLDDGTSNDIKKHSSGQL